MAFADGPNPTPSMGGSSPSQLTTVTFGGVSGDCSVLPATPASGNLPTIRIDLRLPQNMFVHPSSLRFYQLLTELGAVHAAKQMDYGRENDPFANVRATEEWGQPAWVGALIRATDKMRRLQKVARGGELANEAAEDSFRDLAVYAVIGLVLWEQDSKVRREYPGFFNADFRFKAATEKVQLDLFNDRHDCPKCGSPDYVSPTEDVRCDSCGVRWQP